MTQDAIAFNPENEKTYEALISLIENSQGRLAPIVVGCDDENLRSRIIDRYETEAKVAKIPSYRVTLGSEPSITRALAQLKASETYLQSNGPAVFSVTGAEYLLWIKTHEEDAQSELDKFFGYLQWTREALREYPYPIVIWVPHRILRQMSQRAPDFWSWRKAVLRFVDEETVPTVVADFEQPIAVEINAEDTFLPPLEELLEEIKQLEARSPNSASLATLYDKLGQVYARRITHGQAEDLAKAQQAAVRAFEQAIANQRSRQDDSTLINTLTRLGTFLHSQSRFTAAVTIHQESFDLSKKLRDQQQEANSLSNLGIAYAALGQFEQAIAVHQQSLELARKLGNQPSEAASLTNLGLAYKSLGQYQQAMELQQQSLAITRAIGDKPGESQSLDNLGNTQNDFQLRQLIGEIVALSPRTPAWRNKNNQFVRLIHASHRIWRAPDVNRDLYNDALSNTWEYILQNFHQYDPSRGSVITWINNRLKWEIKNNQVKQLSNLVSPQTDPNRWISRLAANDDGLAAITKIATYVSAHQTDLQTIHLRDRPDINCYELFQDRLGISCDPATWLKPRNRDSYRAMSEYYAVPIPTLASFWTNRCLPFTRNLLHDLGEQL